MEIVATAIEMFNRRDVGALAEHSHEDLEIVSVLTAANLGGAMPLRGAALSGRCSSAVRLGVQSKLARSWAWRYFH